jgi:hypothetical protein
VDRLLVGIDGLLPVIVETVELASRCYEPERLAVVGRVAGF